MSVKQKQSSKLLLGVIPAALILIASFLVFYKIAYLGYDRDKIVQTESYYLETSIDFNGHGTNINVSMALPENLENQAISDESFGSSDLNFDIVYENGNKRGRWEGKSVEGKRHLSYRSTIISKNIIFEIDSTLPTTQELTPDLAEYLVADDAIQSDSDEINKLADSLGLSMNNPLLKNCQIMFDYATNGLNYVRYSGTTDALTAYHLGEASCGGKSRLMVAMARYLGIPGRLVGGKILQTGQSKATHIWLELYIKGHWVPFCPTNNYFAEMPSNYLILYYGEEPFLTHTNNINFKYYLSVKKRLVSKETQLSNLDKHPLDILNVWTTFKKVSISLELLKIIIMIPLGVLAVVFFRNIIGIETFGTFMPTLLAIGFRDTGFAYGVFLFLIIMIFGILIRLVLNKFQLLHTPRLAIMLSMVVLFNLGMTVVGVQFGYLDVARVALFPIIILTLTIERLSIIIDESGFYDAIRISLLTLLVAAGSYSLMSMRLLQSVVISFPEVILVIIALYIYIGRYSGFRLVEFFRFKHLLVRS